MQFWEWVSAHKIETTFIVLVIVAVLILTICLIVHCARKSKLFKFLRYKIFEGPPNKKEQHPKLIVEETKEKYGFMGLTEGTKHGKTNNLPIKNPQKNDNRQSHIRKEVRYDTKDNFFDEVLKDYELTAKDKKVIMRYLKNRKKNKKLEERKKRKKQKKYENRKKKK